MQTLHRRVREVARWRRPRLVAKGDPDRDQTLADLQQQIRDLPTGAVVLAEDETHINLLPWVRSTWIPTGQRRQVMTPGTNRRRSIFGAIDLASGQWFYQVTRKAISATFTAFCEQLLAACPAAPVVAVVWTTSSSTAPSWSSDGWPATRGCKCCTARATAPTTTRPSGSGAR
jgi:DDE superfamily endonuclease